jgi:hypothetical protein
MRPNEAPLKPVQTAENMRTTFSFRSSGRANHEVSTGPRRGVPASGEIPGLPRKTRRELRADRNEGLALTALAVVALVLGALLLASGTGRADASFYLGLGIVLLAAGALFLWRGLSWALRGDALARRITTTSSPPNGREIVRMSVLWDLVAVSKSLSSPILRYTSPEDPDGPSEFYLLNQGTCYVFRADSRPSPARDSVPTPESESPAPMSASPDGAAEARGVPVPGAAPRGGGAPPYVARVVRLARPKALAGGENRTAVALPSVSIPTSPPPRTPPRRELTDLARLVTEIHQELQGKAEGGSIDPWVADFTVARIRDAEALIRSGQVARASGMLRPVRILLWEGRPEESPTPLIAAPAVATASSFSTYDLDGAALEPPLRVGVQR